MWNPVGGNRKTSFLTTRDEACDEISMKSCVQKEIISGGLSCKTRLVNLMKFWIDGFNNEGATTYDTTVWYFDLIPRSISKYRRMNDCADHVFYHHVKFQNSRPSDKIGDRKIEWGILTSLWVTSPEFTQAGTEGLYGCISRFIPRNFEIVRPVITEEKEKSEIVAERMKDGWTEGRTDGWKSRTVS